MPSVQPTAPTPAFPLEQPDITISVRQTFGINSDLQVPAFSQASEHVPDLDDAYRSTAIRHWRSSPVSRSTAA
jgi:cobaltochelatase CobS